MKRAFAAGVALTFALGAGPAWAGPPASAPGPAPALPLPTFPAAPTAPDDEAEPDPEPPPEPPDPGTVTVRIDEVAPGVLTPEADLRLTITLVNTGTREAIPRLSVRLAEDRFISRTSLDAWRTAGPTDPAGPVVHTAELAPLAPDAAATATVVVPAAALALTGDWGARGLAMDVTHDDVPLGIARTFVVWYPEEAPARTDLTVAVPVTGPAVNPYRRYASVQEHGRLTAPDGRLTALLAATEAARVTWVLDPAVLEHARASGEGGQEWADRVTAGADEREVLLLPWGDTDLSALARAGAVDVAQDAVARTRAADVPGARFRLAWPEEPVPALSTASLAQSLGADAVVVGPGRLAPPAVLTYTPTGRTTVVAGGRDVTVLTPDARLSQAFVLGWVGPAGARGTLTPAVAAQDLLAELAVINRERPALERHLLVTVPRSWHPDPAVAAAQFAALAEAPWVELSGVDRLLGTADPGVDRGTLPLSPVVPGLLDVEELGSAQGAMLDRDALRRMLADPDRISSDPEREILLLTSQAWRSDPAGRSAALGTAAGTVRLLRSGLRVEESSPINLISESGELPVRVANSLDQDVTVIVALEPAAARLVAEGPVPVTVPSRDSVLVHIPLHAVGSGDLDVRVTLATPDGHLVDADTVFTVRVRAEWENIGTGIIAGLLALALLWSILRTARRGRLESRGAPIAEAGPEGTV